MKHKKIGFDKPIYIFILVFIICLSYTVLSYNPPEQKLHPIDSIDYDNDEPLNINMVENINTSISDDDSNIESVKANEVITNET